MRPPAVLLLALLGAGACYDFTLPEDDDGSGGGSAVTTSTTSGQGGQVGQGGAGAGGPLTPPCNQYSCNDCVTCAAAIIPGEPADCAAYVGCVAACNGDSGCEVGCLTTQALGLTYFSSLQNRCMSVCPGDPPCP